MSVSKMSSSAELEEVFGGDVPEVVVECAKAASMPFIAVGSGLLFKACIASPMLAGVLGYVFGQYLPPVLGGGFVSHTEKCYNGLAKLSRELMK